MKFTTTVSNAGPGTAKSVILGETLPNGAAGDSTISTQPAGGAGSIASGTLKEGASAVSPPANRCTVNREGTDQRDEVRGIRQHRLRTREQPSGDRGPRCFSQVPEARASEAEPEDQEDR